MKELSPESWSHHQAPIGGSRLDVYLSETFSDLTRARIQKLIEEKNVLINDAPTKSNYKLKIGDKVSVFLPKAKAIDLAPENIPLQIYYEDDDLAVLEKPAGMVVHPAEGNWTGTLVHALLHRYQHSLAKGSIGGELRPGIVHRIDKNTSGILVIARTDQAHLGLSQQFQAHTIIRRYTGIAWGTIPSAIDWKEPIARDPKDRQRMAVVAGGRASHTSVKKLATLIGPASLFEAQLYTGRTHQIRVHFSHHGCPLVGDSTYIQSHRSGRVKKESALRLLEKKLPSLCDKLRALSHEGRQFLHASHLTFTHPISGKSLSFDSPLPTDLKGILDEWTQDT